MVKCPRCGSKDLQKKGQRLGRQRYRCKKCSSSFTEGVQYREAPTYDKLNISCSKCGSKNIVRDGKLLGGAQRYLCKDCGMRFSDNSSESLTIQWECPYCGGTLRYSGFGKLGQREYFCSNCKRSCSGDLVTGKPIKRTYFRDINESVECPACRSMNIRKAGIAKGNRQKYICNDCSKHFMTDYEKEPKSQEMKDEIINLVLKGNNVAKVSKDMGFSKRYVMEFMQPYFNKETLSRNQKELIIKYGHFLKVPIGYLAPYIPCSEYACRKFLCKYRKKLKAKSTSSYGI